MSMFSCVTEVAGASMTNVVAGGSVVVDNDSNWRRGCDCRERRRVVAAAKSLQKPVGLLCQKYLHCVLRVHALLQASKLPAGNVAPSWLPSEIPIVEYGLLVIVSGSVTSKLMGKLQKAESTVSSSSVLPVRDASSKALLNTEVYINLQVGAGS